ncbi:hypothetical protein Tco_0941232 [Tanacetum coccineum]|uniref:Uncharacterized protein n=1 Tax=Tanacetum coccineum TaxID=301880 RepID=A0ABQ5DQG5_9ASTR
MDREMREERREERERERVGEESGREGIRERERRGGRLAPLLDEKSFSLENIVEEVERREHGEREAGEEEREGDGEARGS